MDIQSYLGKKWVLRNCYEDESGEFEGLDVNEGTVITPIARLVERGEVILWSIALLGEEDTEAKTVYPSYHDFASKVKIDRLPGVFVSFAMSLRVWSCELYEGMLAPYESVTVKAKAINSVCPRCGKMAYIGFREIECSDPSCNPIMRR